MSFLGDCHKKKYSNCHSQHIATKSSLMHPIPIPNKIKSHLKRMSSFLLFSKKGSMAVEAAVAIPLFLFAILNLFSIILIMGKLSSQMASMQQEAKELSVHAHIYGEYQTEWVRIEKSIDMEPVIPVVAFPSAKIQLGCHARKWIGYDIIKNNSQAKEEEWVYITKTGTVYHRNRNCSYLNPTIHCGNMSMVNQLRNRDGERYRCCEICGRRCQSGICFYTEYGNCYHSSLQCSGLKRTVEKVPLSKVGNRRPCSKCGGR